MKAARAVLRGASAQRCAGATRLITGRSNQSAIATLVDRASRYVRLVHLPLNHGAGAVRDGLITNLGSLPAQVRLTLTWDQGSEMAPP